MFPGRLVREGRANVIVAARYLRQRRRNGSGVVSGDIRREVVRDEPRANRDVLPGRDEEVPKGERGHFDNVITANHTCEACAARGGQGPSAILRAAEISFFFPLFLFRSISEGRMRRDPGDRDRLSRGRFILNCFEYNTRADRVRLISPDSGVHPRSAAITGGYMSPSWR